MSFTEYESFLLGYAERRLGRSLTKKEAEGIVGLLTRRQAADYAESLAKPVEKSAPKPKATPKKEVVKDEE
tara:strand:+ start:134 stop:346 length:213 start_codon:yes stop_codon:yes gene_type:complete